VTAGPTREPYDPVRFISNRSSGKMGYALARTAFRRGARVTLVSGPVAIDPPAGVDVINVTTAREMYDAVMEQRESASVIVKAAAVSDFRCVQQHDQKVKKDRAELCMELEQNPDILKELGHCCDHDRQLLIGFAAESENIEEEARKKLSAKKLDLIAVNDITSSTGGFEVDSNQVVLIDAHRSVKLIHTSKERTADLIWDHVVAGGLLKTPSTPS